jgi:hypothetical protein
MTQLFHNQTGRTVSTLVLFLFILNPLFGPAASQHGKQSLPLPDTSLQPGDVVKIVIDSLANNDYPYPDAGIEATFNFASPANRVNTGPLDRFITMVKGPVYAAMVNHKSSELSEVILRGSQAYQFVRLITSDDMEVYFVFRLGLQIDGEYKDMWMTEAVSPVKKPEDDGLKI